MDLSHPDGRNINDGISSELCSLCYTHVDQVVCQLLQLGPGAVRTKLSQCILGSFLVRNGSGRIEYLLIKLCHLA